MTSIGHRYILVGIETDPGRYHGEHASRPMLLDRSAAEQVLAHIAADLKKLLPLVHQCSMTMAGALFDQTQVLRPQLPVFAALETLQKSSNPGNDFQPRVLSIGASEDQMPLADLQPFKNIPLGLLQILPVLISGPAEFLNPLADEMEHRFLEHGQLSAQSAMGLESHFRVSVNHTRLMTLTDLNALLRLQLEHYGFLPLWELLDAAITNPAEELEVETIGGIRFSRRNGAVHVFFESFDYWASQGGGAAIAAEKQRLQSAYVDWTREYRRYLTMLTAHGVEVVQHLPGQPDVALADTYLVEKSTMAPGCRPATVTEHSAGDLGTVAITVIDRQRQINFYPLLARGLNDVQQHIRDRGMDGDAAFPGRICYDENSRQLVADNLPREI
jgi:hypothetical protein